jgi:hypothetical protein
MKHEQIAALAARPGVKATAAENFLGSLDGLSRVEALNNLALDAILYNWGDATVEAIREGIHRHFNS